jgi:hypothetical protein
MERSLVPASKEDILESRLNNGSFVISFDLDVIGRTTCVNEFRRALITSEDAMEALAIDIDIDGAVADRGRPDGAE